MASNDHQDEDLAFPADEFLFSGVFDSNDLPSTIDSKDNTTEYKVDADDQKTSTAQTDYQDWQKESTKVVGDLKNTSNALEIDFLLNLNPSDYADEIFDFSGAIFGFDYPEITFTTDADNSQASQSTPAKTCTFQEYLKKSVSTAAITTDTSNSASEHEIEESKKNPSAEEILKRIINEDPIEAWKDKIKIPISIPKASPSPVVELEESLARNMCNFSTMDEVYKPSTTTATRKVNLTDMPGCFETNDLTLPSKFSKSIGRDLSPSNNENETFFPTTLPEELIDLGSSFLKTLNLETLYNTNSEDMLKEVIKLVEKKSNHTLNPAQQNILKFQLQEMFAVLNSYTEEMDSRFKKKIYFETEQGLQVFSKNILQEVQRKSTIKIDAIREFIEEKTSDLEKLYIAINNQIHEAEVANAEYTLKLAVQLCKRKMSSHRSASAEDLSKEYNKWAKISQDAFVQAYQGPENLTHSYLITLCQQLEEMQLESVCSFRKSQEPNIIQNLITQISSRYTSEIDRGVMRNVSISTESQYCEMSQTYRSNAERKYSSEISSLTAESQDELRKRLATELDQIHQQYLEEFMKKRQTKDDSQRSYRNALQAEPTCNSNTGTQKSLPVGVHFGFEQLSAVLLVDGKFRTIYGPSPNVITFKQDEWTIGDLHPEPSTILTSLLLKSVLYETNLRQRTTIKEWKSYQIEEILAMVLSRLHLILSTSLHTDSITYVVAVPSTFNPSMMDVMRDAIQIAGIEVTLIRETYGLLTRFWYQESRLMEQPVTAITIVENTNDSADAMCFTVNNGKINPVFLLGYDVSTHSMLNPNFWVNKLLYSKESCLGLTRVVNNLVNRIPHNARNVRVILECTNQNVNRNTAIIKNSRDATNWKLHVLPNTNPSIVEGAAIIAGYKCNPNFRNQWNQNRPALDVLLRMGQIKIDFYYRLKHYGPQLEPADLVAASDREQTYREQLRAMLVDIKAKGKKMCMEKSFEIQDRKVSEKVKTELTERCSNLSKCIDKEVQSVNAVRQMIADINNL